MINTSSDIEVPQQAEHRAPKPKSRVSTLLARRFRRLKSRAQALLSVIDRLRRAVVGLFLVALLCSVAVVVWRIVSVQTVVIEPIGVPEDLAKRGYSPEVVARLLADGIRRLKDGAIRETTFRTSVDCNVGLISDSYTFGKIEVASTGISVTTIVALVREVLGRPVARVQGEITFEPSIDGGMGNYRLHLRMDHGPLKIEPLREPTLETQIQAGAASILETTHPIILAYSQYAAKRKVEAERLAEVTLARASPDAHIYAHDLKGILALESNQLFSAMAHFSRALELDSTFAPAMMGMAKANERISRTEIDEAKRRKLNSASLRYYLRAANSDPGSFRTVYRAASGVFFLWMDEKDALQKKALALDAMSLVDRASKLNGSAPCLHFYGPTLALYFARNETNQEGKRRWYNDVIRRALSGISIVHNEGFSSFIRERLAMASSELGESMPLGEEKSRLFSEAVEHSRALVKWDPEDLDRRRALARSLRLLGESESLPQRKSDAFSDAVEEYRNLLFRQPESPIFLNQLARLLRLLGEVETSLEIKKEAFGDALINYRVLAELEPKEVAYRFRVGEQFHRLAVLEHDLAGYQAAIERYEGAVAYDPRRVYGVWSEALIAMGNRDAADFVRSAMRTSTQPSPR